MLPLLAASLLALQPATTTPSSAATPTPLPAPIQAPIKFRVATFNVEDLRPTDLAQGKNPRLKAVAEVIQRIRPTIIFLNEVAYPNPTPSQTPDPTTPTTSTAQQFADLYLAVPQATDLAPIKFTAFTAPSNTGELSGFDLNNDGITATGYPTPRPANPDGTPAELPADEFKIARAYGDDSWGFGTFPGQYAMALLVADPLTIKTAEVRTFQNLPWSYMHGNFMPTIAFVGPPSPFALAPDSPRPFYDEDESAIFPLSSKSHWDIPVALPNGTTLHLLSSHPTPPAFDGPEQRNRRRNHDEIRFWADYLARPGSGSDSIVDDKGTTGGFTRPGELPAPYILLGDLNADPDEGNSFKNPITNLIASIPGMKINPAPTSPITIDKLDADDTAMFGLRVDYVLPSSTIERAAQGIWRTIPTNRWGKALTDLESPNTFPSDHFPVWVDVIVPHPPTQPPARP